MPTLQAYPRRNLGSNVINVRKNLVYLQELRGIDNNKYWLVYAPIFVYNSYIKRNMKTTLNSNRTVAVDPDYYWQPMTTCPRGVKCQLLGRGGVAVYGTYNGKDTFWQCWAPLPKRKPKLK